MHSFGMLTRMPSEQGPPRVQQVGNAQAAWKQHLDSLCKVTFGALCENQQGKREHMREKSRTQFVDKYRITPQRQVTHLTESTAVDAGDEELGSRPRGFVLIGRVGRSDN